MAATLEKIEGCLVGGAAGDALGYTVEFMGLDAIRRRFGPQGIEALQPGADGVAPVSDDTQMTLFTADGLVGWVRDGMEGDPLGHVGQAYFNWLATQDRGRQAYPSALGLMDESRLFALRAPGMTCLSALRAGGASTKNPLNSSKGCGGVMRVAPYGLLFTPEQAARHAADAAAFTHGHPLGFISAGALAYIVSRCLGEEAEGVPARDFLARVVGECAELLPTLFAEWHGAAEKQAALLRRAVELACSDMPDEQAVTELGEGWVGEECLAVAVFSSVRHAGDFSAALRSAVNHSGDSDSTGAVCGNILGALLGAGAIGSEWTERLEMHGLIVRCARELHACAVSQNM